MNQKDKKRDAYLQRTYGITARQYAAMFKMQWGRCAICGKKPTKRRLHVDHDHRTHVVRGLLCFHCNRFIVARHTVATARSLLAYLDREFDGRKIEEASPKVRRSRATLPPVREAVLPAPVAVGG
jgi:hypothetical protein